MNNNFAMVSGVIEDDLVFSHECHETNFYETKLAVSRLSGVKDYVPIIISENLCYALEKGTFVEVFGQVRTHNRMGEDGRSHLDVYVFAKSVKVYVDEDNVNHSNDNFIELEGYVVKEPIYRQTPSGKSITDILIAVNRGYKNSDYIPCIVWGIVAENASQFIKVGDEIVLKGRFQSRVYWKKNIEDPENGEFKVAYEISCSELSEEMEAVFSETSGTESI